MKPVDLQHSASTENRVLALWARVRLPSVCCVLLGLACQTGGGGSGGISAPPAVTPPIDSIKQGGQRVFSSPPCTDYSLQTAPNPTPNVKPFFVYFDNVPAPSGIEVAIDEDVLGQLSWGGPWGSGAAYQLDVNVNTSQWIVGINPARPSPFVIRIRNISLGSNLTGTAKVSNPALLNIGNLSASGNSFNCVGYARLGVPSGRIVFTSNRNNGRREVYHVRADETWGGQELRQLSSSGGSESFDPVARGPKPAFWPVQGSGVAYESSRTGSGDVYQTGVFSGPEVAIGSHGGRDSDPTIADPGEIAYVFNGDIWKGSAQITATVHADSSPNFCRAGGAITFVRDNKVAWMKDDGTAATVLTVGGAGVERTPVFNPQCTQIAFIRDGRLWIMNADGTGQTDLGAPGVTDETPTFNADGSVVAVASGASAPQRDIVAVWLQAMPAPTRTILTNTGNNTQPSFGPMPDRVAFVSTRDGNKELYTVRTNGLGLIRITQHTADDFDPYWR